MSVRTTNNHNLTEPEVERIARRLAAYVADLLDAPFRGKAHDVAKAKLDGATEIAAIALRAQTPFALELDVRDSIHRHGMRPKPNGQNGKEIGQWTDVIAAEFVALHRSAS